MATEHRVGATTYTTPSDREILITRVLAAPRQRVFEAWTDCEHVPHWMLGPEGWTMPICQIDLRPGGAYRHVWRRPDGEETEIRGVYKEIAPPERLVCTESWGGDSPETLHTLLFFREGRQNDRHGHATLPVEGSTGCGAGHGDDGRHVPGV